jgi:hypothetical protein
MSPVEWICPIRAKELKKKAEELHHNWRIQQDTQRDILFNTMKFIGIDYEYIDPFIIVENDIGIFGVHILTSKVVYIPKVCMLCKGKCDMWMKYPV